MKNKKTINFFISKDKEKETALSVINHFSIDILKEVEYLETKKAEGDLDDSEYQDLHSLREYLDAFNKTSKYISDNLRENGNK
jgi:hypothetical protein